MSDLFMLLSPIQPNSLSLNLAQLNPSIFNLFPHNCKKTDIHRYISVPTITSAKTAYKMLHSHILICTTYWSIGCCFSHPVSQHRKIVAMICLVNNLYQSNIKLVLINWDELNSPRLRQLAWSSELCQSQNNCRTFLGSTFNLMNHGLSDEH